MGELGVAAVVVLDEGAYDSNIVAVAVADEDSNVPAAVVRPRYPYTTAIFPVEVAAAAAEVVVVVADTVDAGFLVAVAVAAVFR